MYTFLFYETYRATPDNQKSGKLALARLAFLLSGGVVAVLNIN